MEKVIKIKENKDKQLYFDFFENNNSETKDSGCHWAGYKEEAEEKER